MKRVVIGSRGSELALVQANHIAELMRVARPGLEVTVEIIKSKGDAVQDVPLAKIGGKGVFTKELELALLEKQVDLAVHSLKDLPTELPRGLCLACVTEREHPGDALVSREGQNIDELPQGARIGTSSLRRQALIKAYRPDFEVRDIRGNVGTRLRKMHEGQYEAIVLAMAGLTRLGMLDIVTQELPPEVMLSAVGQGALGMECREDDAELRALLDELNDAGTRAAVTAERSLLLHLGGGCQTPLGALAQVEDGKLVLNACVADTEGGVVRVQVEAPVHEAEGLGRQAAAQLLQQGAQGMIEETISQAVDDGKPLEGKTVVVTRPREQADKLASELERLGARVVALPMIRIVPVDVPEVAGPDAFDWLVFTSVNGVERFDQALAKQGRSLQEYRRCSVCAIGPATSAALLEAGLPVTLAPEKYVAESLYETLSSIEGGLQGKRFLLPRGDKARMMLPDALRDRGAEVTEVVVYRTELERLEANAVASLLDARPDVITFTSASTATAFCDSLRPRELQALQEYAAFAAIGPVTAEAAQERGLSIAIEPAQHDIPGLVRALVEHVKA